MDPKTEAALGRILDESGWVRFYMGALIALGCEPATEAVQRMAAMTKSTKDAVELVAALRTLPPERTVFPGYVHSALDALSARHMGSRRDWAELVSGTKLAPHIHLFTHEGSRCSCGLLWHEVAGTMPFPEVTPESAALYTFRPPYHAKSITVRVKP